MYFQNSRVWNRGEIVSENGTYNFKLISPSDQGLCLFLSREM